MAQIYIKKDTSDINEEYFVWLCEITGIDDGRSSYWYLARALYNKKFKWFIPNDDNRAFEGKNLREKFLDEFDVNYSYLADFDSEVSMFEVIIGLAYRCESIVSDMRDVNMVDWFWELLKNAELDIYWDSIWKHPNIEVAVDLKLEKIVNRTYSRSGKGGLFPLKKSRKDQRKVELWYQMSEYLVENYYGDDVVV